MEGNLLNEISYLTRLIEQHKTSTSRNLFAKPTVRKIQHPTLPAYTMDRQGHCKYSYVKPPLPPGRVHVNPNFKPKVPGIHINPRIGAKPSVHVNPKMMKNFSAQIPEAKPPEFTRFNHNSGQSVVQTKIEPSVHVNPRLMKELSSKERSENLKARTADTEVKAPKCETNLVSPSKPKFIKDNLTVNPKARRSSNSNLVSLSKRKLVRIRRCSKTGSVISPANPGRVRRFSSLSIRKTKVATQYKLVMESVNASGTIRNTSRSFKNRQVGLNKYKIDRTHIEKVKKRLSIGKSTTKLVNKNASGSTTGLIRIGGILYKSSRNQLVRSSNDQQPSKRKRCIINVKGDRFVMASNGKKLRRLSTSANVSGNTKCTNHVSRVDIGGMTFVEKTPNVLVRRAGIKNNISTKAKQRSIQILRNKMRKNNQPCLIFQRFGYCAGQVKSTCPKLHDKKQVALCRNFLQGKCLLDDCPMSHAVCPEKMPTCKYFLEGCCVRDNCPYLHVKVSSNTPVCTQFLRGYCAEANKCEQRHVYVCPEFERLGNCAKGKYCPYPHKQSSTAHNKSNKALRRKLVTTSNKPNAIKIVNSTTSHTEDRKRYYDEAGSTKEDLTKKKLAILNSIQIMKSVRLAETDGNDIELHKKTENIKETVIDESTNNSDESTGEDACPKRTPLGPLPAYIPID